MCDCDDRHGGTYALGRRQRGGSARVGFWMFFKFAKVCLVEVTLFSFALAFIAELSRNKGMLACSKDVNVFFMRMGDGFSKVVI